MLDMAALTSSELLGIGITFITKFTFLTPAVLKVYYLFVGDNFYSTLCKFHECNLKV
jgi:hypothetical protein